MGCLVDADLLSFNFRSFGRHGNDDGLLPDEAGGLATTSGLLLPAFPDFFFLLPILSMRLTICKMKFGAGWNLRFLLVWFRSVERLCKGYFSTPAAYTSKSDS